MEFDKNANLVIRAPYYATAGDIQGFVTRNEDWIIRNRKKMQEREQRLAESPYGKITFDQIQKLADLALQTIPPRVRHFAGIMGVTYGRITIRNQKTRWGSCSSKGNLNFNCLLMLTPPDVQDYVIVHELCHRKQMNHSKLFWDEVEKVLPDYRKPKKWLRDNGNLIIDSVAAG